MKIQKSQTVSPFGGINFVIKEAIDLNINTLLNSKLPSLPTQSKYNWFDIFMSYWSIFFCGGDCAEDLSVNIRNGLHSNPYIRIPSPDRMLDRIKSLSDRPQSFTTKRGEKDHQFSLAEEMNRLNIKMLSLLPGFQKKDVVLDYDNTVIFTEKADARRTYQKELGYFPGSNQ